MHGWASEERKRHTLRACWKQVKFWHEEEWACKIWRPLQISRTERVTSILDRYFATLQESNNNIDDNDVAHLGIDQMQGAVPVSFPSQ